MQRQESENLLAACEPWRQDFRQGALETVVRRKELEWWQRLSWLASPSSDFGALGERDSSYGWLTFFLRRFLGGWRSPSPVNGPAIWPRWLEQCTRCVPAFRSLAPTTWPCWQGG